MPGKSVKAAVAVVLAAGALAGCGGSPKVGTAALVGDDRITTNELTRTVRDQEAQFKADPVAKNLLGNQQIRVPRFVPDDEYGVRGSLMMLINLRVVDEAAKQAGVDVTGGQVDSMVEALNRGGGAGSITLLNALPRERTRDFARFLVTQPAVMQRLGADLENPLSPATQQAGQRWTELLRHTAEDMDIEVNPRYGTYDPGKVEVGPITYRLSSPDSGI